MSLPRSDFRFSHRMRVRWSEVDMQKIVFNAHYLMYFDTAMADYWRALALPYEAAMQLLGGDIFVKKASVEYHASARYDDRMEVCLRCARIGTSSIVFEGWLPESWCTCLPIRQPRLRCRYLKRCAIFLKPIRRASP
jgi:YbgC/YbaW family acyl-CoA thioester hydrolase